MSRKLIAVVSITAAFILFACKSGQNVTLSYTNAKGEVPQLGNLTFRFNQSLVKDSMLNLWDSADYISFEPRIAGKFRWESPDLLVFSPSQPLAPATTYKAKVRSAVLKYTKFNAVKGGDDISFHTPDLTLGDAQEIGRASCRERVYSSV